MYHNYQRFQKKKKEDKSRRKPDKIWVDKGSEFCNKSLKSWLEKDGIEFYSIHYEGKSVVTERCIKTRN